MRTYLSHILLVVKRVFPILPSKFLVLINKKNYNSFCFSIQKEMETFRKADVLFCMFFLHWMFIKENILLTDSEDKKIKSSELYYIASSVSNEAK